MGLIYILSITGLLLMGFLAAKQFIAVISPRGDRTVKNVYGGDPGNTDQKAYFAFNQGYAFADVFFWGPIQIAGSIGMILGHRWSFLLALNGSVPFWHTGITIFIWDRDMGFRKNIFTCWVVVWGLFPMYGALEMVYCFWRMMEN